MKNLLYVVVCLTMGALLISTQSFAAEEDVRNHSKINTLSVPNRGVLGAENLFADSENQANKPELLQFAQVEMTEDQQRHRKIIENYRDSLESSGEDTSNERVMRGRLMMMWRVLGYLDLDEGAAEKFFPIYNEYQKNRFELILKQQQLNKYIADNTDDSTIPIKELKDHLSQIKKNNKSMVDEYEKLMKKSESILSERQHIKLAVFDEILKDELMGRFRRGRDRDREESETRRRDIQKAVEDELDKRDK